MVEAHWNVNQMDNLTTKFPAVTDVNILKKFINITETILLFCTFTEQSKPQVQPKCNVQDVENAIVNVVNTKHVSAGQEILYVCNPSYQLIGSSKLMCQLNGMFNYPLPQCIPSKTCFIVIANISLLINIFILVTCKKPMSPINGKILSGSRDVAVGDFVVFECNEGYKLVGMQKAACMLNREFNVEIPVCKQGKNIKNWKNIVTKNINNV